MLGFTSVPSVHLQNSVALFSIKVGFFSRRTTLKHFETKLIFKALSRILLKCLIYMSVFLQCFLQKTNKTIADSCIFLVDIAFKQKRILTFNSTDPIKTLQVQNLILSLTLYIACNKISEGNLRLNSQVWKRKISLIEKGDVYPQFTSLQNEIFLKIEEHWRKKKKKTKTVVKVLLYI